jgi:uncharacterized membrane protein YqjE
VNGAGEGERLPASIGGLIGFALRGWAADAPLYLALQLGVFAAYAIAESVVPAAVASSPQGQFKQWVLVFTGLFADAFVIAAVAMGIAARSAGALASARALAGVAIDRWLPVIAVSFLAQMVVFATYPASGLGPPAEPRVLQLIAAPFVWIVWGILGLTGPFVALAPNRRVFAVVAGFVHAFTTSLHRENVLRLVVLAAITLMPILLQVLAFRALVGWHVPRPIFWSEAAIDVLTIGPLAAVQTAFALDFARRAGDQRSA